MDDVRNRLDQDLKTAVSRLRHLGGAAAEELPWTIRGGGPFADEVDGIQANESREVGLATRELLTGAPDTPVSIVHRGRREVAQGSDAVHFPLDGPFVRG